MKHLEGDVSVEVTKGAVIIVITAPASAWKALHKTLGNDTTTGPYGFYSALDRALLEQGIVGK